MGIIRRLNKCPECSLRARLGTRDTWELGHSPYHWKTHRLLGEKDSENIFIQKNMVNVMMGMSTGAVGTQRGHEGGGGVGRLYGMVMPNLSLEEHSRERKQHVAGQGDRGTTASSVLGYIYSFGEQEKEPIREAGRGE